MKITLSKSQWKSIGQKNGWLKTANIDKIKNFVEQNLAEKENIDPKYINDNLAGAYPIFIHYWLNEILFLLKHGQISSTKEAEIREIGFGEIIDIIKAKFNKDNENKEDKEDKEFSQFAANQLFRGDD